MQNDINQLVISLKKKGFVTLDNSLRLAVVFGQRSQDIHWKKNN